jgi:hypothetical protein
MRNRVFISYSRKDKRWLEQFQVHLKPLERSGRIARWDDTMIKAGQQWREEIKNAMASAKVAVLFVSADFLASEFITDIELPSLLSAAETDGAIILPVIVSPCRFFQTENIARFQAVNDPTNTLVDMSKAERERLWVKLTQDIITLISPDSKSETGSQILIEERVSDTDTSRELSKKKAVHLLLQEVRQFASPKAQSFNLDIRVNNPSDTTIDINKIRIDFWGTRRGVLYSTREVSAKYSIKKSEDMITVGVEGEDEFYEADAWYPNPDGDTAIVKADLWQSVGSGQSDRFQVFIQMDLPEPNHHAATVTLEYIIGAQTGSVSKEIPINTKLNKLLPWLTK